MDAPRRAESARDTTRTAAALRRGPSEWDPDLGALLLVPSDSDNSALVLYPADSGDALPASEPVTLVNTAGDSLHATLRKTDSLECGDAAMVRLDGSSGAWAIGIGAPRASLIRMDSIEALPSADSSRLAADIARLASALPMPKDSRFGGLPFAVVAARRFSAQGRQYVVAHLARRLNQEAQPLEERTFVIGERSDSAKTDRFVATYSQRSEGTEDTAEHFDVLAGLMGRKSPLLLLARDQLSQTRYELLERQADGTWRVRWSRTLSC